MTTAVDALSRMVSGVFPVKTRRKMCCCDFAITSVYARLAVSRVPKVSTAGGEPVSTCPVCRAVTTKKSMSITEGLRYARVSLHMRMCRFPQRVRAAVAACIVRCSRGGYII